MKEFATEHGLSDERDVRNILYWCQSNVFLMVKLGGGGVLW
jgi:hypothetical protein